MGSAQASKIFQVVATASFGIRPNVINLQMRSLIASYSLWAHVGALKVISLLYLARRMSLDIARMAFD
jgi:hypothetical protein